MKLAHQASCDHPRQNHQKQQRYSAAHPACDITDTHQSGSTHALNPPLLVSEQLLKQPEGPATGQKKKYTYIPSTPPSCSSNQKGQQGGRRRSTRTCLPPPRQAKSKNQPNPDETSPPLQRADRYRRFAPSPPVYIFLDKGPHGQAAVQQLAAPFCHAVAAVFRSRGGPGSSKPLEPSRCAPYTKTKLTVASAVLASSLSQQKEAFRQVSATPPQVSRCSHIYVAVSIPTFVRTTGLCEEDAEGPARLGVKPCEIVDQKLEPVV